MAWQRKIPFGYRIQNGKPTICLQEAQAVRNIFNSYLAGASYSQIAAEMTQRLRELATMPHLLTIPQSTPSPSADALRLERELTLSLNRGEMGELVKAMALAVAAESYASLADPTPAHRMEQLRHRLQSGPADAALLAELLDVTVKGIHLGKGPEVALELVNGSMIQHHREEASA